MTMTLEQVRDELRRPWNQTSAFAWCAQLADAIDAHLSQPQPVAQGEAVGVLSIDNFRDCRSMQNVQFDYTGDLPVGTHNLYATPTIAAGHRVVPVERDGEVSKYKDALTDIQARVASGYFVDANHLGEIAKKALGDGNND